MLKNVWLNSHRHPRIVKGGTIAVLVGLSARRRDWSWSKQHERFRSPYPGKEISPLPYNPCIMDRGSEQCLASKPSGDLKYSNGTKPNMNAFHKDSI